MPPSMWSSLLLRVLILATATAAGTVVSLCQRRCGAVDIPYPFGIGNDSCFRKGFEIQCKKNVGSAGDVPVLATTTSMAIPVLNLSVAPLPQARVLLPVAWQCFNPDGSLSGAYPGDVDFNQEGVYRISNAKNELYVLGCNTLVYVKGVKQAPEQNSRFRYGLYAGCVSVTNDTHDAQDGACAGLGCCRVDIPPGLTDTTMSMWSEGAWSHANQTFCPCDYAFIVEKGGYTFVASDLTTRVPNNNTRPMRVEWTMPLSLDWAIRDNGNSSISCAQATTNKTDHEYACRSNSSQCVDASNGPGYFCNCTKGYQGNPYVIGGCTNINECQSRETNNCTSGRKCIDTDGGYTCQCKFFRSGKECSFILSIVLSGTTAAIFFLVPLLWFICKYRERRMKTICFDKNGGKILKGAAGIVIFTQLQLKKITNNYNTLIGKGAFGTVFLGTTDDRQRVAVKRNQEGQFQQGDDFVNEIIFQFRISHTNLVRLVGCCLETNIPVLVYEYVSNGSLYNLLHVQRDKVLTLPTRLDIAMGSAQALAYMHSHGDQDRIHGDVKSANILFHDDLKPKVSDFGSSRLLSTARYVRAVPADMSYIDPIYLITNRFVQKSDVYSFGIVLLELITRKMVNYGKDGLPMDFIKSCKEKGNGREMYDNDILSHDGAPQCHYCIECLDKMGALALRCLMLYDVDERPTMAEVVAELMQAVQLVDNCILFKSLYT